MRLVLTLWAAMALAAHAQTIVAETVGAFTGSTGLERAVLIQPEDPSRDATLLVTRGQAELLRVPDAAWSGHMGGRARLETIKLDGRPDSLRMWQGNIAIGRNRWEMVQIWAFRDGRFLPAGFTYSEYDTLDPAAGYTCDVNLLTGRGELQRTGRPVQAITAPRRLPREALPAALQTLCF